MPVQPAFSITPMVRGMCQAEVTTIQLWPGSGFRSALRKTAFCQVDPARSSMRIRSRATPKLSNSPAANSALPVRPSLPGGPLEIATSASG